MNNNFKIGIIGHGFLGSAVSFGFSLFADIKIYDKFKKGFDTIEETIKNSEFLFFCLPTPMFDDNGEQDLGILDSAISDVHKLVKNGSNKIAIIKSTVLPGTNRMFQRKYPNLKFVSNPEHLTARNNRLDFICASKNVLGGEIEAVERVEKLYKHRFGNSMPIFKTNWESAELEKYVANIFFCVKLSYFNFVFDIAEKLGIDYEELKDMVLADGRIGRSHCDVGSGQGVSDNKRQWGGGCFPKDINALIHFTKNLGMDPKLISSSWEQNLEGRPERDWEDLPGVITKRDKSK